MSDWITKIIEKIMDIQMIKKSFTSTLKSQMFTIVAIILLIVGVLGVFLLMFYVLRQQEKPQVNVTTEIQGSVTDSATPTPTVTDSAAPTPTVAGKVFTVTPVTLSPSDLSKTEMNGSQSECQPESFDPKTTNYSKRETGGTPAYLYEFTSNGETYHFNKNGWMTEGEDKKHLISPYDVDYYEFGCLSSSSYVIEVTKKVNQTVSRVALFTNVDFFTVLDDQATLLIRYNRLNSGTWNKKIVLYNVVSSKTVDLPIQVKCMPSTLDGIVIGQQMVLFYAPIEDIYTEMPQTQFCVFSNAGSLVKAFTANLNWIEDSGAGGQPLPVGGAIFSGNSYLSLYDREAPSGDNLIRCHAHVVSLNTLTSDLYKMPLAKDDSRRCPKVDIETSADKTVRYRVLRYYSAEKNVENPAWNSADKAQ